MKKKYVLITGSSRGIGALRRRLPKRLSCIYKLQNSVDELAETEHEILASGGGCTASPAM